MIKLLQFFQLFLVSRLSTWWLGQYCSSFSNICRWRLFIKCIKLPISGCLQWTSELRRCGKLLLLQDFRPLLFNVILCYLNEDAFEIIEILIVLIRGTLGHNWLDGFGQLLKLNWANVLNRVELLLNSHSPLQPKLTKRNRKDEFDLVRSMENWLVDKTVYELNYITTSILQTRNIYKIILIVQSLKLRQESLWLTLRMPNCKSIVILF